MVDKVFRVNKNLLKCLCNNLHLQPARDIFIRNIIFILEDLKLVEDDLPFLSMHIAIWWKSVAKNKLFQM